VSLTLIACANEMIERYVRYWLPAQPVDATLPILMGKDGVYDDTSRIFSRLHCGTENGDFGIAGNVRKTLGFKPQQKE
jgi:hypothetical protein